MQEFLSDGKCCSCVLVIRSMKTDPRTDCFVSDENTISFDCSFRVKSTEFRRPKNGRRCSGPIHYNTHAAVRAREHHRYDRAG